MRNESMKKNHQKCLSCGSVVTGKYCSECGQPSSTHRFSFKQVFTQEMIHRVIYLDHGLIYSVKELFSRPGHSIREYIQGNRAKHFNYFSLLIVLILFVHLLESFSDFHFTDLVDTSKNAIEPLEAFRHEYPKIFFLFQIPIYALFSFLIFRKAHQNYSEHFVLNAYKSSALLVLNSLFIVSTIFIHKIETIREISQINTILVLAYGTWFYFQYFSVFGYNKISLILLSFLCAVSPLLLTISFILLKTFV
jgi:ribosomal protein L37E